MYYREDTYYGESNHRGLKLVKLTFHDIPAIARHVVASHPGNRRAGMASIKSLNLDSYQLKELTSAINRIELAGKRGRKSTSGQFEVNAKMRKTKIRW